MHRISNKLIFTILFLCAVTLQSQTVIGDKSSNKPWMLFTTQIFPPRGPDMALQFTKVCYQKLLQYFDSTSFQVIQLQPGQKIDNISNRKKDLILSSDPSDYFVKGTTTDTLVVWLRYKVGFTHSRITIPYKRGKSGPLPDILAQEVFRTVTSEFLGTLSLQAGPQGVAINIAEDIIAYAPCTFFIPPGTYIMQSTFPNFQNRLDTLEILPGKQYSKRILLLPVDN